MENNIHPAVQGAFPPGTEVAINSTTNEHLYASMLQASPFMLAIFEGKDLIIKDANDAILSLWNKGKEIIGKPLSIGLPESLQLGSLSRLQKVYETGEPYHGYEVPLKVMRNGSATTLYFTFIYQAQKNSLGDIEGVAIIAYEVTPQAALNKKIKESEERFQAAVSAVQGIIWTNNANGQMEGEQPAWASLTGQSFEEYQGYGWSKAVHPDDAEPTVIAWQEAVARQDTFVFEHRLKVKDGSWRSFSIRAVPLKNDDGTIREWVGVHTDITEQRQAANALKESEEKFRTMAESSDILIGVNNETVDAVYFNTAWERLTGRPVSDLLNLGWADLLHPDDREPFMQKFLTAFNNKESYEGEFRMKNKEGSYSWIYAKVAVRLNKDGSYAGHISSCIDITDRRRNETALKESEANLRNTILAAPVGMCVVDATTLISEIANESFVEIVGKPYDDIVGHHYLNMFADAKASYPEALQKVISTGEAFYANEVELTAKQHGKQHTVYISYVFIPMKASGGTVTKVVVWVLNNTLQVEARKKVEISESRLRNMIEQAPVAMLVSRGEQMVIESVNTPMLPFLGKKNSSELIGKTILEALPELSKQPLLQTVIHVQQTGIPYRGIEQPVDLVFNGHLERRYFNLSYTQINDNDETPAVLHMAMDVTEQVINRKRIEESEAKYRSLFETMDQGFCIVELIYDEANRPVDYLFLEVNPVFEKQTGIKDAVGKTVYQLIPNIEKNWVDIYANVARTGEAIRFTEGSEEMGRIFDVYAFRVGDTDSKRVAMLFSDITERRASENMLQYRKALLEAHNESSVDGILLVDARGKILSYNKRFIEIWRMPPHIIDSKDDEVALSFAMSQLVKPNQFLEKVKWLYEHPTETSVDELEFNDGRIVLRHGYPVVGDDGTYYAWSWSFRDVTEQRIAENRLRDSEQYFHYLTDTVPAIIWITGLDGQCTYLNKTWYDYTGQKDREGEGFGWIKALHPDDVEPARKTFLDANSKHKSFVFLYRLKVKDGSYRWAKDYGSPRFSPEGKYEGMIGSVVDVHEETITASKIKESEKQFRLLADTVPQLVWTADVDGNLNYFNQSVFDYSGLSQEQIFKDGWLQMVHPDDREENLNQWKHSIQTGKDFIFEHRFRRYDGEYRWQLSRAIAQRDANGNINLWVGSSTDIQKIKEEEKRKGDFIKMASHELKTPVTSIKGYVQLLLSLSSAENTAALTPTTLRSSLERVDKQIVRLTRLITEMLDLSRLDESKLELKKENFSIRQLVEETVQDILHTSSSHEITVVVNADGVITGDRDRIQQVLINFINNAIKYSPLQRQINVLIHSATPDQISVSVKDSGIGINRADQEKIFERFYRVTGKNEETFSGFGIGLFIAKQIIERHKGSITVQSELGQGSVFTFNLPCNNAKSIDNGQKN